MRAACQKAELESNLVFSPHSWLSLCYVALDHRRIEIVWAINLHMHRKEKLFIYNLAAILFFFLSEWKFNFLHGIIINSNIHIIVYIKCLYLTSPCVGRAKLTFGNRKCNVNFYLWWRIIVWLLCFIHCSLKIFFITGKYDMPLLP